MKNKITWFGIGLLTAFIAVYCWNWVNNRPSSAVADFPEETQKIMLHFMPWLESAKGIHLGPYTVIVPSDISAVSEAIIYPTQSSYPQIFLWKNDLTLMDSKKRVMSIRYSPDSKEFESYNVSPNVSKVTSYFDSDFDGQYDLKVLPEDNSQKANFHIRYQDKWLPIIIKDKKKYVEVNNTLKEVSIYNLSWKFVE